jgi:hypothetical protein
VCWDGYRSMHAYHVLPNYTQGAVSRRTRGGQRRSGTHILEAEELVAAVAAQRAGVEQQPL